MPHKEIKMNKIKQFPFIKVAGSPYEMGYQHGQACDDRIKKFVELIIKGASDGKSVTRQDVLNRTKAFQPLFEEYCPKLVEEVRGLADGAGISFEEALLLQIRGEINNVRHSECTAYAISGEGTVNGEIIIGQNSDMTPVMEELGIVLHLTPEKGPKIMMWTFGGHLGYHGMNSAGVAHFANALSGGPGWRFGLPHYPVKRRMLEQTTVAECLQLLDNTQVCSSGNYVLTGGCRTIIDVELTPEGYAMLDDAPILGMASPTGEGFIVHTNHFLSPRFATPDTDARSSPDSFKRLKRLRTLIKNEYGSITVEMVKQFLSDHENPPISICRHLSEQNRDSKTVASLIAEPESGRFHVCVGNPCENEFQTYEI
jgi:isopenicillin-N N-acyltransferase-like protein